MKSDIFYLFFFLQIQVGSCSKDRWNGVNGSAMVLTAFHIIRGKMTCVHSAYIKCESESRYGRPLYHAKLCQCLVLILKANDKSSNCDAPYNTNWVVLWATWTVKTCPNVSTGISKCNDNPGVCNCRNNSPKASQTKTVVLFRIDNVIHSQKVSPAPTFSCWQCNPLTVSWNLSKW